MATLTDEQYQQFLAIYDEVYDGLGQYDTHEHAYPVTTGGPWDDESFDGVYRVEDNLFVQSPAVDDSMRAHLEHTIFDGDPELVGACWERLNQSNR